MGLAEVELLRSVEGDDSVSAPLARFQIGGLWLTYRTTYGGEMFLSLSLPKVCGICLLCFFGCIVMLSSLLPDDVCLHMAHRLEPCFLALALPVGTAQLPCWPEQPVICEAMSACSGPP